MASTIPIKNVYFLLCYAWNRLEQGAIVDIDRTPTTELVDLFALVLCDGLRHLARRGLEQGYQLREEDISGVRGRLDVASSVRRFLFVQGRSFCSFDEISVDTGANRILKATLKALLSNQDLDRGLKKRVRTIYRSLQGIQDIKLSRNAFASVRVTSNNLFYRFLLNVCSLIFESMLVDETSGSSRFRDFTRDDDKMARLFQSFLFNFISRECQHWTVRSENIDWQATSETDPDLALLPRMQTDISVTRPGEYLIIDAKYYRQTLGTYFEAEKIHSANLYQLTSYLMNAPAVGGTAAKGMLIYPKVDRSLREHYEILGRKVSVCTVNLDAPWWAIDQEIRDLMN